MLTKEEALANKIKVQKEAEESVFSARVRSCLELATGVGKTKIGLSVVDRLRTMFLELDQTAMQTLIVVPTEEMRDVDWPEEAKKWNISLDGVKIICYAALAKEVLNKYHFILYDEYHKTTIGNLNKLEVYLTNPRVYALGLTATLPKEVYEGDSMERIQLMRTLLPTSYKLTTDQAVDLGLISDFEIVVLKYYLDSVNVNIPGGTKKNPFKQTEKARYDFLTKNLQRATFMSQANTAKLPMKFAAISARVQFLSSLPSKLRIVLEVLKRLHVPGTRTLVFAGSIEQANRIGGKAVYHSGSTREGLDNFQSKASDLLVAVKALNEGKNLTEPDLGIIAQIDSVDRNLIQRIGRLVRIRYNKMDHKAQIIIIVTINTAEERWFNTAIADFETNRIKQYIVPIQPLNTQENGIS